MFPYVQYLKRDQRFCAKHLWKIKLLKRSSVIPVYNTTSLAFTRLFFFFNAIMMHYFLCDPRKSLWFIYSFITNPGHVCYWNEKEPKVCCKIAMCTIIRCLGTSPYLSYYNVTSPAGLKPRQNTQTCMPDSTPHECVILWYTVGVRPAAQWCCICCLALWLDSCFPY